MKKKTKIILAGVVGVLVLAGAAFGMVLATKSNTGEISGSIADDLVAAWRAQYAAREAALVEGTGRYDWKKNETDIPLDTADDQTKCYSNNETYVEGFTFGCYPPDNTCTVNRYYIKCTAGALREGDEMYMCCVLEDKETGNRYVTETAEWVDTGLVEREIEMLDGEEALYIGADYDFDFENAVIKEVWVRYDTYFTNR